MTLKITSDGLIFPPSTLEELFLDKYMELERENEDLKKQIEQLAGQTPGQMSLLDEEDGIFDLHRETKAIWVLVSPYSLLFTFPGAIWEHSSAEELRNLLRCHDALTLGQGVYDNLNQRHIIQVEREVFPCTALVRYQGEERIYGYDPNDPDFSFVEIVDEPTFLDWTKPEHERESKLMAASMLRETIEQRITDLERGES